MSVGLKDFIAAMKLSGLNSDQILTVLENYEKTREADRKEATRQRVKKHRENNSPVTQNSVTCVTSVTKEKTPLNPPLNGFPHPSLNPPLISPPKENQKLKQKGLKNSYPVAFEEFWQIYPPNGASKSKTFESWKKAINNGVTYGTICDAARSYRSYLERTRFETAHATTWLNQERWTVKYAELGGNPDRDAGQPQKAGSFARQSRVSILDAQVAEEFERIDAETSRRATEGFARSAEAPHGNSQAVLSDYGNLQQAAGGFPDNQPDVPKISGGQTSEGSPLGFH